MLFFVQEAEFGRATAHIADETFPTVGANGLAAGCRGVGSQGCAPKKMLWSVLCAPQPPIIFLFDLPLLGIRSWITTVNDDVVKTI
jgi:hypothetical protein